MLQKPRFIDCFSARLGRFAVVTIALWSFILAGIFIRAAYAPAKRTVLTTYLTAGTHWLDGQDVYFGPLGFVYSPLAAASFAPFALLPSLWSNILWRVLNVGLFLGGVSWWLKAGFHRDIPRSLYPLLFLLLLPPAIGNFNNAQVNPLVTGLLMIACVAVDRERFTLAALCVAVSVYFKIYPLAMGLLLVVLHPRRFSWRLLATLIALGALTFLLQRPEYVLGQYRLWWATRLADNRLEYKPEIAPRDLWLLLQFLHIPISQQAYKAVQLLSGAGAAAVCVWGRWKQWPRERLTIAAFSLGCAWMLLCGPATESVTYIMLAPPLVLALMHAYAVPLPRAMRALVTLSYAVFTVALIMDAFLKRSPGSMSVQAIATVLFLVYSALLTGNRRWWSDSETSALAKPGAAQADCLEIGLEASPGV